VLSRYLHLSPLRGLQAQRVAFYVISVMAALAAARYVMRVDQGYFPKPLVLLLALAGAAVLFSIAPEQLFLGWIFIAPLFQGVPQNAAFTGIEWAVYIAPCLVLAVHTIRRPSHLKVTWYDYLPALFVVLVFISMAVTSSTLADAGLFSAFKAVFVTVAIGPVVYYFVVYGAPAALTAARVLRVVLLACGLQACMAIVEWGTGRNLWHDTGWRDGIPRSVATLQNPAVLGAFVGAGMVIGLAVLCWDGPRELRLLSIIVVGVGVPALATTLTRGPILATIVVGTGILVLGQRTRLLGVGVSLACALAIFAAWPSIKQSSVYNNRLSNTQNIEARVVIQDWSLKLAKRKPILGYGYDSFDRVKNSANFTAGALPVSLGLNSTSHDTFLTVLVQYGGVGLLILLLPQAVIMLLAASRARAPSPERWLLVGGIGAVLVVALSASTLDLRFFSFVPAVPWLFLGLMRRVVGPGNERASVS
jgi:O-antigen ligase